MTSKKAQTMTAKALMLISVLLLAACDGGIFGTGGDDADSAASIGLPEASPSDSMDATMESTANEAGTVGSAIEPDSTAGTTTGGATAGITAGDTAGDIATTAGDTAGTTGFGADGGNTAGTTGTTGGDIIEPSPLTVDMSISGNENSIFTNDTPTLNGLEAQLIVVNTSSQTLNVVSPSTNQDATRLEIIDISPNSLSESSTLSNNATNLAIVDSNYPDEVLISYSDFNVGESTLTTLLVRDGDAGLSSVALVTETQTSDPGLAKVRIVQAGTLGDTAVESELRLLSAGDNPGGIDLTFGPLSFFRPQSDYQELLAGDYELVDLAGRIAPFAVTLSGNTVYTLLLTGNGINDVTVIVDSEARLLDR